MDRRKFLRGHLLAGSAAVLTCGGLQARTRPPLSEKPLATPPEIEGPFYPLVSQDDTDFDLTQIKGHKDKAKGTVVTISGQVKDLDGQAIPDATVDLWQANAAGKYRHPHDNSTAKLDPNFQGWAILKTDKEGKYRFKTIVPGAYPVSVDWARPPHIHFKVSKLGYEGVTTQMYFPDHPLNDKDRLLNRKSEKEKTFMIAQQVDKSPGNLLFDFYITKL